MNRPIRAIGMTLILVAAIGVSRPASAGIHQVWDEAHAFKPQTLEKAAQVIEDLHRRTGKDLMVETFPSVPDDLKAKLQAQGKERFYEGWVATEGHDLGVNGVIIVVTLEPAHIQVEVGQETRRKAFTLSDREELVSSLVESFKKREFDEGLLEAVQFVHDRIIHNGAGPESQPTTRPATEPASQPAESHPVASQPEPSKPGASHPAESPSGASEPAASARPNSDPQPTPPAPDKGR